MTNDKLFTPFEITHFHDGKHTNADHPAPVDIENVIYFLPFPVHHENVTNAKIDIPANRNAVFIPPTPERCNRLHHQNISVSHTGGQG